MQNLSSLLYLLAEREIPSGEVALDSYPARMEDIRARISNVLTTLGQHQSIMKECMTKIPLKTVNYKPLRFLKTVKRTGDSTVTNLVLDLYTLVNMQRYLEQNVSSVIEYSDIEYTYLDD